MSFIISFSDDVIADLDRLHGWIEETAGTLIADDYDRRIRSFIRTLSDFPHRGTPHGRGASSFRTITYHRRQVVAYVVHDDHVEVLRVLDARRDLTGLLPD